MSDLPEPPTPADCDLTDFGFMPLDIARLRRSKAWLAAKRRPELGFYMVNLWTAAWHDKPAGSLEDDDEVLCDLAMCDPKRWPQVREAALRGWVKCADGRLYHLVVAEKAVEAWGRKTGYRDRLSKAREAKAQRKSQPSDRADTSSVTDSVTEAVTGQLEANDRSMESLIGTGTGTGTGTKKETKQLPVSQEPPATARDAVPMMPALSDPAHRWAFLADGEEVDEKMVRRPLVAGFYLDVVCRAAAEAAGIHDPNWRSDWRPVIAWLRDKLDTDDQILPAIRRAASRPNYNPAEVRSLAYFDAAVRQFRRVA